MSVYLWI